MESTASSPPSSLGAMSSFSFFLERLVGGGKKSTISAMVTEEDVFVSLPRNVSKVSLSWVIILVFFLVTFKKANGSANLDFFLFLVVVVVEVVLDVTVDVDLDLAPNKLAVFFFFLFLLLIPKLIFMGLEMGLDCLGCGGLGRDGGRDGGGPVGGAKDLSLCLSLDLSLEEDERCRSL